MMSLLIPQRYYNAHTVSVVQRQRESSKSNLVVSVLFLDIRVTLSILNSAPHELLSLPRLLLFTHTGPHLTALAQTHTSFVFNTDM